MAELVAVECMVVEKSWLESDESVVSYEFLILGPGELNGRSEEKKATFCVEQSDNFHQYGNIDSVSRNATRDGNSLRSSKD